MSPFTFSPAATKIARARKHLKELEEESSIFLERAKTQVSATLDKGDMSFGFYVTIKVEGPPESLGAIVGDVIHNLRSALDLSACELVRSVGQSDEDVYFPFSRTPEDLDLMIERRHLDRAGRDAVNLVRGLKPYRNGNQAP